MFSYTANPVRVVFGRGTVDTVGDEVRALGLSRVLLLGTRTGPVAGALGPLVAAEFREAAMHTPADVTERSR